MDGAREDGRWCGRTGRVKIRRRAVDRGRERMKVEGVSWRKVHGGMDGGGVEGVGICRMM